MSAGSTEQDPAYANEALRNLVYARRREASVYSSPVTPQPLDVVGIGENSVDYVYRVPGAAAPNAKLRASAYRVSCGGQVATTLAACAALGLRAAYIGTFGDDGNGQRARDALTAAHVDTSHAVARNAPNRHAVILVDERNGDRTVVWQRDPRLSLRVDELPGALIAGARLLHVDDLDEDASIAAARIAAGGGIPVTSDIDRVSESTHALIALSTVPIFSAHVPATLTGERDPERALRALRRSHAGWLCVTLGTDGAMLLDGDRLHHVPAFPVDAADTTGAGDVFRAGFIYALLQSRSPTEILRFASAAAAISCTREGAMTSVPALDHVEQFIQSPR
jgi:sugar/nucleoside kinase (ribokinase family)